ncbi:GntR family transcriptional regulator [Microbacterium sp. 22242]|uniref:GntR family transcriptional regulator n=1 Tax=Microbacterium sp. 22242 TaxID=3453896 RepID=UPI003F8394EE
MTDERTGLADGDLRPLRDQVRETLRAWIVSGRLAAGVRLHEGDLAKQLGVSRVPVREAIRMLEAEGTVSAAPRGGVMVTSLSLKDVHDLFDIREALEALVARLAATRVTPREARRIQALLDEVRFAFDASDHEAAMELNHSFHLEIARAASNPALMSMLEPIGVRLRWHFSQDRDPLAVLSEHQALLDAVAGHDPDLAATLAASHVRRTREAITSNFPSEQGPDQHET